MAAALPWQRGIRVGQHFVCLASPRPNTQYSYATLLKEHGALLTVRMYDARSPEGREARIQRRHLMYPITRDQLTAARKSGWPAEPRAVAAIINWKKNGGSA